MDDKKLPAPTALSNVETIQKVCRFQMQSINAG